MNTLPFWPNNLATTCLTLSQSTIEQGHSHTTTLTYFPTGTTPPLLGPYSLTTLTKDWFKGSTLLQKAKLFCISLMLNILNVASIKDEITCFNFSQPLPLSPSGIIRKVILLLEANSEILINLPRYWISLPKGELWSFLYIFLLKPMKLPNSTSFPRCSSNHPTSSFSKPKEKTTPLLNFDIEIQVPPNSHSKLGMIFFPHYMTLFFDIGNQGPLSPQNFDLEWRSFITQES